MKTKKIKVKKGHKINSLPDDGHQDGEEVIIIAKLPAEKMGMPLDLYYCLFKDGPYPIAVTSSRIMVTDEESEEEVSEVAINFLNRLPPELSTFN